MRSPVIAFSLLAAAAVSPTLVSGAPTSPNPGTAIRNSPRQLSNMNQFGTNALTNDVSGTPDPTHLVPIGPPSVPDKSHDSKADVQQHRAAEQQLHNPSASSVDAYTSHSRRSGDQNTAGGNSYTGATSDTSGGNVVNVAHGGDGFDGGDGAAGVTNDGNTGGAGGDGFSGFSYGGDGDGKGPGGNAYSGAVGQSYGGDVVSASDNDGGIDNTAANTGGAGGFDESGDATGGDAAGNFVDGDGNYTPHTKRAQDSGTAGGNAYTGASSNVDGGNVINHSDSDGEVVNDDAQTGGAAGDTYSGFASGGDGDGFGPGGNAYSGATGSAVGGTVVNSGGFVDNTAPSTGGAGGESESGDAEGGDA